MNAPRQSAPGLPQLRHYHGQTHHILFWLLVADLPSTLLHEWLDSKWTLLAALLLLLSSISLAVACLVKQSNTDLAVFVKNIPWLVLALNAVIFLASMGYGIYLAAASGFKSVSADGNVAIAMSVLSTTSNFVMGLTGLVQLRRFRDHYVRNQIPLPVGGPPAG